MKHFTSAFDVQSVRELIKLALHLKKQPHAFADAGKHLTLGTVFMNPSLRTRLSTAKAAQLLGMNLLSVNAQAESWTLDFSNDPMNHTTVENIREAAAVLGEYCDILGVRSFPTLTDKYRDDSERDIIQWMNISKKPFISLESATRHPLQSLADMVTIQELFPQRKPKVVLMWAPHVKPVPHAVANSFAEWMYFMNADFTIACPDEVRLNEEFTSHATVINDQNAALRDADIVYVKSWASYDEYGKLHNAPDWFLTAQKLKQTADAKVMHCLPVRRDVELSSEILDSPSSAVIRQAANRVPAAQAVLLQLIRDNYRSVLNLTTNETGTINSLT
jgi:N-succinyl-L-ornithine transcarbamylase